MDWSPWSVHQYYLEGPPDSANGENKRFDLEDYDGSRISTTAREKILEQLGKVASMTDEDLMFDVHPLYAVLTLASLDQTPPNEDVLVFVRNTAGRLEAEGYYQPELVAFFTSRDKAQEVIEGKEVEIPPSLQLITITYIKTKDRTVERCLSFLKLCFRHRPSSSLQYGLIANARYFRLLSVGLAYETEWKRVFWNSDTCIEKLYSCVKFIRNEALQVGNLAVPRPRDFYTWKKRNAALATYSATVSGRQWHLLPIYSRAGHGRKSFVVLAASEGDSQDVRVFKYSWYSTSQWQSGRERPLLEKLVGVPGVVQIDTSFSIDSVQQDSESEKIRRLLALKTYSYPLSSCRSVLEFLEAMYDLLEVLRYVVQEKRVLHRDISWTNILIRPKHASDVEIKRFSDTSDEEIKHKYRFISDIFNEKSFRVRIVLADFDHAFDLKDGDESELEKPIGTYMFTSCEVLHPRPDSHRVFRRTSQVIVQNAALLDSACKYAHAEEKAHWDRFYQNELKENVRWLTDVSYPKNRTDEPFRQSAIHDAESVFWICVLFFNRMRRRSWKAGDKVEEEENERNRGGIFEALLTRGRLRPDGPNISDCPDGALDEHFHEMLHAILAYMHIPWNNVPSTGKGQRHQFHLHDFMQRALLKEIIKMRKNGEVIPLDERPLRVRSRLRHIEEAYTSCSGGLVTALSVKEDTNQIPSSDDAHEGSSEDVPAALDVSGRCNCSSVGTSTSLETIATQKHTRHHDRDPESDSHGSHSPMPELESVIPNDPSYRSRFPEEFWDILRYKKLEKLWLRIDEWG